MSNRPPLAYNPLYALDELPPIDCGLYEIDPAPLYIRAEELFQVYRDKMTREGMEPYMVTPGGYVRNHGPHYQYQHSGYTVWFRRPSKTLANLLKTLPALAEALVAQSRVSPTPAHTSLPEIPGASEPVQPRASEPDSGVDGFDYQMAVQTSQSNGRSKTRSRPRK